MKGGQNGVPKSKRPLGKAASREFQMQLDRFTVGNSRLGRLPARDFF
jgi:hypothetical protein